MARKSKSAMSVQKIWEEKIARAKQVKKNWKDLFKVQLALEYLDGKQRPSNYDAAEWITVNNVYSHLKAQLPALYSADPYFYVKVKRSYVPVRQVIEQYEKKAKVRQSNLNYYKDELELKPKARLAIQDAMFAFGVVRVEHVSTLLENPDKGKPIYKDSEDKDKEPEAMMDDTGNQLMEPDFVPVNSRYNIARVHFDDFLFDEDAGPLKDSWSWVAERVRVPYEDVLSNPLFKKSAVKALKGRSTDKEDEDSKERDDRKKGDIKSSGGNTYFKFSDEKDSVEPEICILWKIFDLKKKKWLVIGEGGTEPLVPESDLPKGVEEHPYSILRFTLRDDSPYPIPPMSQGIDPAKEYNVARSDILKHRKRFNRKYQVYMPGLDNEDEASKLEHGDDGTIIKINQPVPCVLPIQDAQLDQMRWTELGYLKNEMIELFGGSTGESRGIAEADSATQAGILDSRLQMKEGDALSEVIDFTRNIARKLDQLVQAHIDTVQAVRVTGVDGMEYMETITPADYEEINGEYIYEVNVGSTMPRLPQMERASWLAFLQLLGNVPALMTSKRLLKRMGELHHIEDETMLEELVNIGKQMMQAQAEPQKTGSMPNVSEQNPAAAMGGMFGGAAANQTAGQS